ncbi:sigma-70 family RNA polymerase sigma factor [Flagellimonas hymeniacidonis]|uniref:Sigma-70 family RNA polymerase sigma factor n=1 Tax=Flagellimonas hymeniacidonis TaxID=2603628 RepID=A0A5C8VAK8_9FLAO|nr:sigma-70 family RNA polymerase sigma factor [Flagellimonas hymeniacidonis]TXN37848.1 sigma-70 family RNA polymerase sigma factor [Flagellimonas hymeniacidonis]
MMDTVYRSLLTYAYNIIGSYADAHDVVQDVIEKYIGLDKSKVENEVNYLIKSVINHSINFKNRSKKFSKYGVWLPEPVTTESADTPLIKEQVANYSLLVLFEGLNPKERAVFILKEGFDYKHSEIAQVLEISVENSRQLFVRAKKKLKNQNFKKELPSKGNLSPYIDALMNADTNKLESLFTDDIRLMADGGDTIKVVTRITDGKQHTAELLQYVYAMFLDGKEYTVTTVNHQPAIWFKTNNRIMSCMIFNFDENQKVNTIYSMVAPEKLKNMEYGKMMGQGKDLTNLLKQFGQNLN